MVNRTVALIIRKTCQLWWFNWLNYGTEILLLAAPRVYQEKRPEFENNRYCSVLLFLTISCLVRTKTINLKQQLSRAGNFNISDNFFPKTFELSARCTATEMIPTIEMISATEMTPNHHRNDTYSQSKWSRHKFLEPWLKWTWDFAIYSKFFVYSCKQDSKQRKIEKAIRLITVLYTDFIFKILTFF